METVVLQKRKERGLGKMISIIVPVYNAEKYIETTIEMVCRQTYPDWELILVDDYSRDKSVEKIRECIRKMETLESGNRTLCGEEKIRLIQKPKNEGAAKARNTGIDAANGRYIAFWMRMTCGIRRSWKSKWHFWKSMVRLCVLRL